MVELLKAKLSHGTFSIPKSVSPLIDGDEITALSKRLGQEQKEFSLLRSRVLEILDKDSDEAEDKAIDLLKRKESSLWIEAGIRNRIEIIHALIFEPETLPTQTFLN